MNIVKDKLIKLNQDYNDLSSLLKENISINNKVFCRDEISFVISNNKDIINIVNNL